MDGSKAKRKSTDTTPQFMTPQFPNSNAPKRQPNFRMANVSTGTNVVDVERARFKEQLMALRQRSDDPKKIGKNVSKKQVDVSPRAEQSSSVHDSSLEETLDSFGFPAYKRKTASSNVATTSRDGKTFANLQTVNHAVSFYFDCL
jgi:hypothetical protein